MQDQNANTWSYCHLSTSYVPITFWMINTIEQSDRIEKGMIRTIYQSKTVNANMPSERFRTY